MFLIEVRLKIFFLEQPSWLKFIRICLLNLHIMSARILGGRQQRKRKLEALVPDVPSEPSAATAKKIDSQMVFYLVCKWAWGFYSAIQVQSLAMKAYDDMRALVEKLGRSIDEIPSSLKDVAELGSRGRWTGNIQTELKLWLGEPSCPPPTSVPIAVKVSKPRNRTKTKQTVPCDFMLPHILFSHLFANDRQAFDYKFLGLPPLENKLQDFWSEVVRRKDPRIVRHPMCACLSGLRKRQVYCISFLFNQLLELQ